MLCKQVEHGRCTFFVRAQDLKVDISVQLRIREGFDLVWIGIVPDGLGGEVSFGVVSEDTYSYCELQLCASCADVYLPVPDYEQKRAIFQHI